MLNDLTVMILKGRNCQLQHKITLLVATILATILFVFGDVILGRQPVCLYHGLFGVPCPLCGMTRGVYELMHLRLMGAWAYNPLVYALLGWYLLEAIHCLNKLRSRILGNTVVVVRWAMLVVFVVMLVLRWFKYFPLP